MPSRRLSALPPVACLLSLPSPVRSPSRRLSALPPVACPLSLPSPVRSPSRRLRALPPVAFALALPSPVRPHIESPFRRPSSPSSSPSRAPQIAHPSPLPSQSPSRSPLTSRRHSSPTALPLSLPFLSLAALPVSRRPSSPVALLLSPPATLASHRDRVPNALPSPSVPPFVNYYLPSRRSSSRPSPPVDPSIPCPRSLPSRPVALVLFPPFPSPSLSPLPFRPLQNHGAVASGVYPFLPIGPVSNICPYFLFLHLLFSRISKVRGGGQLVL
ncbi:unnamed protein product [Closterium sp. NIES-65]|nr:unnamed protein product [Closterium sp. NIES-65]